MDRKKNQLSPAKDKNPSSKKPKIDEDTCDTVDTSAAASKGSRSPAPALAPAWFTEYMISFESRMQNVIANQVSELTAKVSDHEEKLTSCAMLISDLEKQVDKLKSANVDLAQKMDDLENRTRRNNLVFYGIPEVFDSPTLTVVNEVFSFVGLHPKDLGIERCHRTPTSTTSSRQALDEKPRMIHICFSSFQTKEMVRQKCVKVFKSTKFKGRKLFVSDDYSKKVMQQRKNKRDEFQSLKDQGKRPFFLFPARLAYKDGTGKLHIVSS